MNSTPLSFNQLLDNIITQIINPLIMLIAAAAFVLFLYEVYQLIRSAGGDTDQTDAKRGVLWGLIGLVIIFSVYGILNIATSTFNLPKVAPITNVAITTPAKPKTILQKIENYLHIGTNEKQTKYTSTFSKVGNYFSGSFSSKK